MMQLLTLLLYLLFYKSAVCLIINNGTQFVYSHLPSSVGISYGTNGIYCIY